MEKQRSFSIKPIKSLVFFFTVLFSIIFLTSFSIWVFNSSSVPVQKLTELSKNISKDPFLEETHVARAEIASLYASVPSYELAHEEESKITTDAESKYGILDGNLAVTPFNASLSSDSVNFGVNKSNSSVDKCQEFGHSVYISNSTGEESQELSDGTVKDKDLHVNACSGILYRKKDASGDRIEEKNKGACDITKGSWVFDESYPLYTNVTCPFIDEGFSCEANGRLDKDYMKWRWQPQDCDIPRFNATKMLELIRGKRLVFVGDSINRNQWESMLCLLMGAVKDPKKVYETRGRKITKERGTYSFRFVDYKCTVEYYVTHFLVHESKARLGKKRVQTLRIDTIDKGSSRWRGADILVFNTAHWWSHYKTKAGINYYQEGDRVHPRLDVTTAFQKALITWASWVDKTINPRRTRIFFRSSAPSHFSGGLWNSGGHCKEASRPINTTFPNAEVDKNMIVEDVSRQMKNPVTFLNITHLSDYRVDAHPSIYGRKREKVDNGVQDCSHWCLPGVPDTWNELLYYYLLPK